MGEDGIRGRDRGDALAAIFDVGTDLQASYDALVRLVSAPEHQRFLVVAHEGPDGDAIGATLGACHVLWALGKEAVPFNIDPIPHNFRFLPAADRLVHTLPADARFDVTLVLDCAERHRVGERFPEAGWGTSKIVVMDHHQTWDPHFADHYVRDTQAAAVGEMVFRLALTAGVEIDQQLATCCYASIVTDTGSFRYSNTSPTTFNIVSRLLAAGVSPWEMTCNIYENDPLERVKLLGRVLETLTVSGCGRLAFICIDRSMINEATTPDMLDGFINYARGIRGVEVATQLREVEGGRYKVSFRSRGRVNVADLAASFGGGGHHNAAGCHIDGDVVDIQARLANRLGELLGD